MRRARRGSGGTRSALAAALLLVVQAIAAAFALGAGAAAAPLDAFGNPICAAGADYGHRPGTEGGQLNLPECCVSGCAMAAAGPGAPPAGGWELRLPIDVASQDSSRDAASGLPAVARLGLPGSPRAPPFAA